MQSIVNEVKIARGQRIGKVATLAGLGFLIGGLVVSLALKESSLFWISFVCLVVGILISSVGTMNMNRWVREPRADEALAQALKGYDDRYRLYSYLLPAQHVLLCPVGLYVLTAMGQDGVVRFQGGKFRRDFSLGRVLRFMADEGMGRPFSMADAEVRALQEYLESHDAGEEVEIQNILVFYNPRAKLEMADPPRPVVEPKHLKRAIRKQQGKKLPGGTYRELKDLFDGVAG